MLVIMGQMRNHLWGSESLNVSAGLANAHFWRDFVDSGHLRIKQTRSSRSARPGESVNHVQPNGPVIALTLLRPAEVGDLMNTAPEVGVTPRRPLAPLFGLL